MSAARAGAGSGAPLRAAPPVDAPALLLELLDNLSPFWGERDMASLHQPVWAHQFGSDALVVRDAGVLAGYLLGTAPAGGVAYVNAVATRGSHRGRGVGRTLYETFLATCRARGVTRVEAITGVDNAGSRAFHARLGFHERVVADYAGRGLDRVLFRRDLPPRRGPVGGGQQPSLYPCPGE